MTGLIPLAIVGLGKFGRRHVEAATASGRFRVAAAVVRSAARAAEYAAARSIRLTEDFDEVLGDPRIEAVSLVTPHSMHAEQVIRVARAGKHVLAEKPFALTAADARSALSACAGAGVVAAVGHDNRFYPSILEIKRLVDSGALGTVTHAEANLSHDSLRNSLADPPAAAGTHTGGWRLEQGEAPVGAMAHLGIHRIDSFVQLFGRIVEVYAVAGRNTLPVAWADPVSVLLKFEAGMTAYVASSLGTPLNSRMQVFGSEGWAEATGPHDFREYVQCSLRKVCVHAAGRRPETREFEAPDSVMLNFRAFADAIEGKRPYPVPAEQIIHVPAVLEAIGESLASGVPVGVRPTEAA